MYKYVARIEIKKTKYRMLKGIWDCNSLSEAWAKAKELYPNDKIIDIKLSDKWLEKNGGYK